eukprot:gene5258-5792_t
MGCASSQQKVDTRPNPLSSQPASNTAPGASGGGGHGAASSSAGNHEVATKKASEGGQASAHAVQPPAPVHQQISEGGRTEQLSDSKLNVNGTGQFNFRPVHSAVRWNKSVQEVEALLDSAEAVNCADTNNGNCPIHIAAQNGHDDLVALLIRKKCTVDAKNMKGNTALHMSIGYDYYNTSKLLIDAGADLEALNDANIPAKYGLEGDKALGIAALANATTVEEVKEAFDLCDRDVEGLNRVSFAQAGLKAKKALGPDWTSSEQDRFKALANRLT